MPTFSSKQMENLCESQLLQAARDGDLGAVKAIITEQGKDVVNKCMNEFGQTPLHLASKYVFYSSFLLRNTPIHFLCSYSMSIVFALTHFYLDIIIWKWYARLLTVVQI